MDKELKRGIFIEATSCADCYLNNYGGILRCKLVHEKTREHIEKKTFHKDCPMNTRPDLKQQILDRVETERYYIADRQVIDVKDLKQILEEVFSSQ